MIRSLCLSFMQLLDPGSRNFVPDHVDQLIKSRFIQQLQNTRSDIKFSFEDSSCPEKVSYFYSGDSLITNSQSILWVPRLEITLTELIDGKKMDFPFLREGSTADPLEISSAPIHTQAQSGIKSASGQKTTPKWIPLLLGGLGVTLIGAYISSSQTETPPKKSTDDFQNLRLKSF